VSEKKMFEVAITETLRRVVLVEASSEAEAHQRAADAWHNGEVRLEAEDSDGAEFYVLDSGDVGESRKGLCHIDGKNCFIPKCGGTGKGV